MNNQLIYTDGSCKRNPDGPGSSAAVLLNKDSVELEFSIGWKSTTNNRAELLAILIADLIADVLWDRREKTTIVTDSVYCQKCCSGKWKRKKNKDIWQLFDQHYSDPSIQWVKGHNGNKWNERADELASKPTWTIDEGEFLENPTIISKIVHMGSEALKPTFIPTFL
jgi:ribonuclease HI